VIKTPLPTDAELAILTVLWQRGPSTVREVHEALSQDTGYTTILKLMQIMAQKGLVGRDESQRSHVYRALGGEADTQRRLLKDLADRAFAGSTAKLVMRALATKPSSKAELAEIRELIDQLAVEPKGGR
jgi:predicted transcriptional regulator